MSDDDEQGDAGEGLIFALGAVWSAGCLFGTGGMLLGYAHPSLLQGNGLSVSRLRTCPLTGYGHSARRLCLVCLDRPLDFVYLHDNRTHWEADGANEARYRANQRYFIGGRNVEFHSIARIAGAALYVPVTANYDTIDCPLWMNVLFSPVFAYHNWKELYGPPECRLAVHQVAFSEFAVLAVLMFWPLARDGVFMFRTEDARLSLTHHASRVPRWLGMVKEELYRLFKEIGFFDIAKRTG